jgi:hypothetical protein
MEREIKRLQGELDRCKGALKATSQGWAHEVAEIAALVGAPEHTAELAVYVRKIVEERDALRAALR